MSTNTDCRRCGTCCKKGGPSFHHEDKNLIEEGSILLKYLYTIRKGETVYDNVKGTLQITDSDIIKIKSQKGSSSCIFFNATDKECKIYENRPVECKVLNCRDTAEIEQIYHKNRLTRKELISGVPDLLELIESHQERCDYNLIRNLAKERDTDQREESLKNIFEMIQYDNHIRLLITEKGNIAPDMTDFLFGRPLRETIRSFGLKIEKNCLHFINK